MEEPVNPYQAPVSSSIEIPTRLAVVPAGSGRRFLNLIVDYVVYFALTFAAGFVVVMVWGDRGARFLDETPGFVFGAPILLAYYIFLEGSCGRTVGKFLTGTIVVNESGGSPSWGQVILRSLGRFIPFEAFSFLGSNPRGWHDRMGKTYVVSCRS